MEIICKPQKYNYANRSQHVVKCKLTSNISITIVASIFLVIQFKMRCVKLNGKLKWYIATNALNDIIEDNVKRHLSYI